MYMDLELREAIEQGLNLGNTVSEIARATGCAVSTVSREVRKNSDLRRVGCFGFGYNACRHRFQCTVSGLCTDCTDHRKCRNCNKSRCCNNLCGQFEYEFCERLARSPHVCNGCENRKKCTLEKIVYDAASAQRKHDARCSEAHTGLSYTEEEIRQIDQVVSPLIRQGQSLGHILTTHCDEVMASKSTLYRLLDDGLLKAKNLDLPRRVRFSTRKKARPLKINKKCREGRTYEDYLKFMQEMSFPAVVQMDSVEGRKGGKLLLTIHFVRAELMLAYLRDANTAATAIEKVDWIYTCLGHDLFVQLFPLVLTDNGTEFSDPVKIEYDWKDSGQQRTTLFYCDAGQSQQKGSCERNHEFIRMVIPKGVSMDGLEQEDIDLLVNHINSYYRPSLGNRTPYEAFRFMYGQEALDKLGIRPIPPDQVVLRPDLLKKREKENAFD